MNLIESKRLLVSWASSARPDGRWRKLRRNKRAASVYVQLGRLEVVVWYA